jgi:hypothetical protein
MPSFSKAGAYAPPFGVNEFLRSWEGVKTESYTLAMNAVPYSTVGASTIQRVLQPGTVMAKITSGPNAGKIGVFQSTAGTAAQQTLTPSGTWAGTAGTFTIGDGSGTTVEIPVAATATAAAALINTLPNYVNFVVTGSGGPMSTGAFTFTFTGINFDGPVPTITFAHANVTGGTTPNATPASSVTGVAGNAADGRGTAANIVGVLLTAVPWQTTVRDVEVSVCYRADVVQGWCIEYDVNGLPIVLTNTTAAYMQRGGAAGKLCDIGFH